MTSDASLRKMSQGGANLEGQELHPAETTEESRQHQTEPTV